MKNVNVQSFFGFLPEVFIYTSDESKDRTLKDVRVFLASVKNGDDTDVVLVGLDPESNNFYKVMSDGAYGDYIMNTRRCYGTLIERKDKGPWSGLVDEWGVYNTNHKDITIHGLVKVDAIGNKLVSA